MYRVESIVFDIAMVAGALWIVKRFWKCFYEEKKKPSVWSGIFTALYCLIQMWFQLYRGQVSLGLSLLNMGIILGICVTGYESKGKSKYFLLIIIWAVWALMEFLAVYMIGGMHLGERAYGILGEAVSKILMMGVVYCISIANFRRFEGGIPNKVYIWLFFIPIGSIYIAIHEFYTGRKLVFSLLEISILLVFNLIIFEMYMKMNEFYIHQREKEMYAQQAEMIAVNTAEQKRMLEEFHEEKHNLVNELVVLKELVESDRKHEAVENIDAIINGRYYVERIADTGNSTVDAIINFKYVLAREYGIAFVLKAFIPHELPILENDIGVVLGNALDNAIEAVKSCSRYEKKIEISMGVKKEAWIIVIRNPYEKAIKRNRAGEIITGKADRMRHGYGLKSIQKIAEKYQGDMIVESDENIFTLTVVLNFGQI